MLHFLFSGEGRIRRRDYFLGGMALFLLPPFLLALYLWSLRPSATEAPRIGETVNDFWGGLGYAAASVPGPTILVWLAGIVIIGLGVWAFFALSAKRLHDMNASGFWSLLVLLPGIGGWMLFIVLSLMPGTSGSNRYGRDPITGHIG